MISNFNCDYIANALQDYVKYSICMEFLDGMRGEQLFSCNDTSIGFSDNNLLSTGVLFMNIPENVECVLSKTFIDDTKKQRSKCSVASFAARGQSRAHESIRKAIVC